MGRTVRFASEAEERQRVFSKQRLVDAQQVKQMRGEAKRRREQVRYSPALLTCRESFVLEEGGEAPARAWVWTRVTC